MKPIASALLLLSVFAVPQFGHALPQKPPCPNELQCYSEWEYVPELGYWECGYYFRKERADKFKLHQVVYHPKHNWIYYFNPVGGDDETGRVWCRAYVGVDDNDPLLKNGEIPDNGWFVVKDTKGLEDISVKTIKEFANSKDISEALKNQKQRYQHPLMPGVSEAEAQARNEWRMLKPERPPKPARQPS